MNNVPESHPLYYIVKYIDLPILTFSEFSTANEYLSYHGEGRTLFDSHTIHYSMKYSFYGVMKDLLYRQKNNL